MKEKQACLKPIPECITLEAFEEQNETFCSIILLGDPPELIELRVLTYLHFCSPVSLMFVKLNFSLWHRICKRSILNIGCPPSGALEQSEASQSDFLCSRRFYRLRR
ncbi:hypothetical protein TNCT_475491 [Trichonephila clavata]|uniref:Uncharacterized protein n=1 Tax=Trichonephila clavata TaxID=2740835 RepID=A0A8X6K6C2_TRICU|nr:hypothetical protein TNCT_475491 [Trichonephila clavata]